MPTMVSFQKNIKKYQRVLGYMSLINVLLFRCDVLSDIFRHRIFCHVQIVCPICSLYVASDRFDAHRLAHRRSETSRETTPSFNITVNPSTFDSFFNHEHSRGERLTLIQRSTILALHGLNIRDDVIAHLTHCDPRTIQHWIDYYQEHHSLEDEPRSGRPRVTSEETDTLIAASAIETPITTPRAIRSELGIEASVRTIRRRLDEAGLFGRVARMEYPFTEDHINQRLAFAREYGEWTAQQWDRVLFSDESYIYLGQHGNVWVQRPEDTAFLEEYMVHGQSQFAPKIGIWGCFSSHGVGPMRLYDDTMDARLFTDTMARLMKPHALRMWPNEEWLLHQDNASYHGSRAAKTWFHNNGVSLTPLPPYSPDLNPIENLWADLKRRVEARNARNMQELKEIVTEEWTNTTSEYCSRLAHSMPTRLETVVEVGGFRTPY